MKRSTPGSDTAFALEGAATRAGLARDKRSALWLLLLALVAASKSEAQANPHRIDMIYMGGNDCPPCVRWRAEELPRLQQREAFRTITFTYVQKSITSAVPPAMFLPDAARPYKDQLDAGSGGQSGSAQVAIFVDGRLYDYYFGSRDADDVERMILAIRNGTPYPYERCVKRDRSRSCSART